MSQVLIVDGSATNRLQLRFMVERLGLAAMVAADLHEAVDRLNGLIPQVVLIDIITWEKVGGEVPPSLATTPLALITHPDGVERAERFKAGGIVEVLARPVDSATLSGMLAKFPDRTTVNSTPEVSEKPSHPNAADISVLHLYAQLGHDLRTPLNAILGFSDMLADELRERGEPSLVTDVKRIHAAGDRMLGMLDEVVDLARADLKQLTLTPQAYPLKEAFETIRAEMAADGSAPVVELITKMVPDGPTSINTDARRFRQILASIIKVVRVGGTGPVTIHASGQGERLKLAITAPKFGMTTEEINSAFGPLDKAPTALLAKLCGVCMSLALSKRILDVMQGNITAHSNEDTTTIELVIPVGQPPATADVVVAKTAQIAQDESTARPIKIILAEDSPVNQSLMRSMLKRIGRDADIASNGMEVLALLRKSSYDLILMDVNMPEMDGIEATEKIMANWPAEKRPKIIALTGAVNPSDIEACKKAGMNDYLAKPIQSGALKDAIERMFG